MARDWLSTLWPASFNGIPFYVERHAETGGRRVKAHQFPGSDTPFIEDLGRLAKKFMGAIYLASDSADLMSTVLMAAFDGDAQPGVLVLPTQGQLLVNCGPCVREASKDRLGYIAFHAEFWLSGASSPVQTAAYAAQLAFDAADNVAANLVSLTNGLALAAGPGWLVAEALASLEGQTAALEALSATQPVDPTLAPALSSALSAFYSGLPPLVSGLSGVDPSVAPGLAALGAQFVPALPANSAVAAFGAMADAAYAIAANPAPGPFATSALANESANNVLLARLEQANAVQAYAQALLGVIFTDRPAAVQARADALVRLDAVLGLCSGAQDLELYDAVTALRSALVGWFAQTIVNLAPVMTVQVNESLPSLALAWALYSDPTRAAQLVAMNKVPHPTFMPERFEALAT